MRCYAKLRDSLSVKLPQARRLRTQSRQDQAGGRDTILGNREMQTRVSRIQILQPGLSIAEPHACSARHLAANTIANLDLESAVFLRGRHLDPSTSARRGNAVPNRILDQRLQNHLRH